MFKGSRADFGATHADVWDCLALPCVALPSVALHGVALCAALWQAAAVQRVALRCALQNALRCIALRLALRPCVAPGVALSCALRGAACCYALPCGLALRCVTCVSTAVLHCLASLAILRYVARSCVSLRCISLRCMAFRCVASHCPALHIALTCRAFAFPRIALPCVPCLALCCAGCAFALRCILGHK